MEINRDLGGPVRRIPKRAEVLVLSEHISDNRVQASLVLLSVFFPLDLNPDY